MLNPAAGSDKGDAIEVFPSCPTVYTIEFLLSLKDLGQCKEKPADLPDFIDKDKVSYDGPGGKPIRKQRRAGPTETDGGGESGQAGEGGAFESAIEPSSNWGKGKGKRRDHYNGWQPSNPDHHEEEFNQGAGKGQNQAGGKGAPRNQQRIIPGKGMRTAAAPSGTPALAASWDHQPALANVYTKQHQGVTGAPSQVTKGLDAFSMGDIRQAERMIESGKMNIDEYARKMASGEISKAASAAPVSSSGFFAEDDDDTSRRPWGGARIIPGSQTRATPSPPAAPPSPPVQTGKDSNMAGLALLQMLVDRKAAAAAPVAAPKPAAPAAPRQLSQQQINDLIAMSKRGAPKPKAQIVPGQQSRANVTVPPPPPPQVANPQVAALLEQLHRQQMAQQQSVGNQPTPPECQQQ